MTNRLAALTRGARYTPEWTLAAGALLGALAVTEVLLFAPATGSVALLLALGTTVPLALPRGQVVAAAVTITMATIGTLLTDQRLTLAGLVAQLAVMVRLGWSRGARAEAVERDASRRALADSQIEHAARGERARISRELHDVVAHHISMIVVQAETARLTTPGMPAEGASRLVAIGDTAREALTEMRRLLGVLREDAEAVSTRAPQPGLQQLGELVDEARDLTGACTRFIVQGQVTPLDPGVELTAYRIVQEALTNVRRHAADASVDVELHYTDDGVSLRIRDNGPGPRPDGRNAGHGLLGMRERAAAVGGRLWTGSTSSGGFLVEATLPKGSS